MELEVEAEGLRGTPLSAQCQEGRASPRIATDIAGARILLEAWENSGNNDSPRSLHATTDFFLPFLEANTSYRAPHIALWQDGATTAGVLIGRITVARPKRTIGPVRIPTPRLRTLEIVHGGLQAGSAQIASLQLVYLREILSRGEVDCISIHHLPFDSEIDGQLFAGLCALGDSRPAITGHWFTELTDDDGKAVITNSSKTRRSFRRKDRKLETHFNGQVHVRELRQPGEVAQFIDAAAGIGKRSYQGGLGVGVSNDPHWHRILNILAASGNLRGYLLEADGINIAYGLGAIGRGTCCYMAGSYLPEFRKVGPGGYLLRRIFEHMQEEGVRWFDFGFGNADYKQLYGSEHRNEATLHLFAGSAPARIARVIDSMTHRANHTARYLLERTGMLEYARRWWRRSLEWLARK
ncbi:GNAT family N-acetyltransferase [uncultured Microbulbifer sp.]|uniref:GNAT family N-acetyltransferase n=1 Tax=uncultured Microbulbifer sp. TaxID=348147 RepID=UPI0025CE8215|nr:GNAT family N-acetyltransferase [uncultured Microbulbifer sp.]